MAVDFRNSETKDNLMRAFAGESQARNRYTFGAGQAKREKQEVISRCFSTRRSRRRSTRKFSKHLKDLAGETIHVDGGYPVDLTENLAELCGWLSTMNTRNTTMYIRRLAIRQRRRGV